MRKKVFYIRSVDFNEETGESDISPSVKKHIAMLITASSYRDVQMYGERTSRIVSCIMRKETARQIKEGDLAYLNANYEDEVEIGSLADYVVLGVIDGNKFTEIKFEKMQKED